MRGAGLPDGSCWTYMVGKNPPLPRVFSPRRSTLSPWYERVRIGRKQNKAETDRDLLRFERLQPNHPGNKCRYY